MSPTQATKRRQPHPVQLFTFKEGLLSRVAHDLRLHVERVSLTRMGEGDDRVLARFEADSIVVDGAMKGARFDPRGLSSRDKAKILDNIRGEVLRTRAHPHVEFRGRAHEDPELAGDRLDIRGELSLCGVTRPLSFPATRAGELLRASVTLTPSHFGIAPYKALAGAIRLQDRVRVDLELDLSALSEH